MGRPALNKTKISGYRVKPETLERLRELATKTGYTYGDGAALGELLDAIAEINPIILAELIKLKS
jgi:predicted DNA-binding protein